MKNKIKVVYIVLGIVLLTLIVLIVLKKNNIIKEKRNIIEYNGIEISIPVKMKSNSLDGILSLEDSNWKASIQITDVPFNIISNNMNSLTEFYQDYIILGKIVEDNKLIVVLENTKSLLVFSSVKDSTYTYAIDVTFNGKLNYGVLTSLVNIFNNSVAKDNVSTNYRDDFKEFMNQFENTKESKRRYQ